MAYEVIKPVYVLYGDDEFLRDTYRKEIVSHLLGDADPQMCVSDFDATAELVEVLDEVRTIPFLAPRRVVILRDADQFISTHRQALERYLQSPSEKGTLILIVSSWPKNTKLAAAVSKIGQAIICSLDKSDSLIHYLREMASKRGKKLTPEAADILAQCVGADLAVLDSEIEKLSIYTGQRNTITAQDVSAMVTATAGATAFALTNAIAAGQADSALSALGKMLNKRGDEFPTLGQIAWHLRKVLRAKQLLAVGKRLDEVLRSLRVFYNKQEFKTLLNRRSLKAAQKDFLRLIRTDLAMKSGADPRTALEQLVIELCS